MRENQIEVFFVLLGLQFGFEALRIEAWIVGAAASSMIQTLV